MRARARRGPDLGERAAREAGAETRGLGLAFGLERHVGAPRVPARPRPRGLAVAGEPDLGELAHDILRR